MLELSETRSSLPQILAEPAPTSLAVMYVGVPSATEGYREYRQSFLDWQQCPNARYYGSILPLEISVASPRIGFGNWRFGTAIEDPISLYNLLDNASLITVEGVLTWACRRHRTTGASAVHTPSGRRGLRHLGGCSQQVTSPKY